MLYVLSLFSTKKQARLAKIVVQFKLYRVTKYINYMV